MGAAMSEATRDNIIVTVFCIGFASLLYSLAPKDEDTGAGVPQYNVSIQHYLALPVPTPTRYIVW